MLQTDARCLELGTGNGECDRHTGRGVLRVRYCGPAGQRPTVEDGCLRLSRLAGGLAPRCGCAPGCGC